MHGPHYVSSRQPFPDSGTILTSAELCSEHVPREMFEQFGILLNDADEPTTSPLLEFFEICCVPTTHALKRNQEFTAAVLLNDSLPKVCEVVVT